MKRPKSPAEKSLRLQLCWLREILRASASSKTAFFPLALLSSFVHMLTCLKLRCQKKGLPVAEPWSEELTRSGSACLPAHKLCQCRRSSCSHRFHSSRYVSGSSVFAQTHDHVTVMENVFTKLTLLYSIEQKSPCGLWIGWHVSLAAQ